MADNKADLVQQLKNLRLRQGMTVKELGKLSGLDPNFISGIENGRLSPKLETLGLLAAAFGLNVKLSLSAGEFEYTAISPTPYRPVFGQEVHGGMVQSIVRFPKELNEHIIEICERECIPRTEAVRRIVRKDMEREQRSDSGSVPEVE